MRGGTDEQVVLTESSASPKEEQASEPWDKDDRATGRSGCEQEPQSSSSTEKSALWSGTPFVPASIQAWYAPVAFLLPGGRRDCTTKR